jgi:hypothetical protein
VQLEGEGRRYRDGKPKFLVIGASKEPEVEPEEEGHSPGSSTMFELRSFKGSARQPFTPVRHPFDSQ